MFEKALRFLLIALAFGVCVSTSRADCPNCKIRQQQQMISAPVARGCECGPNCDCSGGGCGCMSAGAGCVWYRSDDDSGYYGLYRNGVQIAGYDSDFDEYRTYDRDTDAWSKVMVPPWGKRVATPNTTGAIKNFGNDYKPPAAAEQVPAPKYRIKGKPSTREEVIQTIQASAVPSNRVVVPEGASASPKLPDDKTRLRVTAIGPGREAVDRDMATSPDLAKLRSTTIVYKSYDPTRDWEADGFKATGSPTISIIDPVTQKELHRQNDYDGAAALASTIQSIEAKVPDHRQAVALESLRKADPTFDPAKTPDVRQATDWLNDPNVSSGLVASLIFGALHLLFGNKV